MMITITEQGPPLEESTVLALEKTLGVRLPADYREFLLRHNGGRPSPDTIDIEGLSESPTDIQTFFGFDQKFDAENIIWNIEVIEKDLDDPSLLPIASDGYGDLFFLSVSGPDQGTISFIEFVEYVPDKYFVASSFSDLLARLRP